MDAGGMRHPWPGRRGSWHTHSIPDPRSGPGNGSSPGRAIRLSHPSVGAGGAEAGDEGQAAARARGAVTEETVVASGAGGIAGDVDLGGGEAGLEEDVTGGGPQVEEPAARGGVGAEEGL